VQLSEEQSVKTTINIKKENSISAGRVINMDKLVNTLGRSRTHFEDSRFNISLVTATSTRIQSQDVLHGAHVITDLY
jgi:hypothetical protein